MRLGNYYYLLMFFLWLPLILFFTAYAKRKREKFFSTFSEFQKKHIVIISENRLWIKRVLLFSALAFITFASARPQMGESEIHVSSEGIDIAVIFDVSLSMLAEDEDGPRFEKGKRLLIDAVAELEGDRIALVPFAGAAFLQLPLTADYNTAFSLISTLRPGIINSPGSSIFSAVELATETLKTGSKNSDKMIVIISDGEDPDIDFDVIDSSLKENKINLAILPLGSEEGAPVKLGDSYIKDKKGDMVISKLQSDFFRKCKTELNALEIKKGETLSDFISGFKNRTEIEEKHIRFFRERFQLPLLLGIILYFLFLIIPVGRKEE